MESKPLLNLCLLLHVPLSHLYRMFSREHIKIVDTTVYPPMSQTLSFYGFPLLVSIFHSPLALSTLLPTICALLVFLSLREILAPPHQRTLLRRKQWQLPPGPPGYPLIGNLLEYLRARRSPTTFIEYVRFPSLPDLAERWLTAAILALLTRLIRRNDYTTPRV